MSLINDALKDLDARLGACESQSPCDDSGNDPQLSNSRGFSIMTMFGVAAVLCCSYIILIDYGSTKNVMSSTTDSKFKHEVKYTNHHQTRDATVSNSQNTLDVFNNQTLESAQAGFSVTSKDALARGRVIQGAALEGKAIKLADNQAEIVHDTDRPKHTDNHSSGIDMLLSEGYRALKENKLSFPKQKSALYYFNQVLTRDPSNESALLGIADVKRRYIDLTTSAYKNNEDHRGSVLLSRLKGLLTTIDQSEFSSDLQRIHQLAARVGTKEKVYRVASVEATTQGGHSGSVAIAPSHVQVEADILSSYHAFMRSGDFSAAEDTLEQALQSLAPNRQEPIVSTLFEHYLKFAQIDQASSLINDRERLGEEWPYERASILNATNRGSEALAYLSSRYIDGRLKREQSLALYAAMSNEAGDYLSSKPVYQKLIAIDSEQPVYWLGLAIAEDSVENHSEAYKSYQVALRHGGQSEQVSQFIQQRIRSLKSRLGQQVELSQW